MTALKRQIRLAELDALSMQTATTSVPHVIFATCFLLRIRTRKPASTESESVVPAEHRAQANSASHSSWQNG